MADSRESTARWRYASVAPEPMPFVPKWDPLRRDLLPDDYPEFEHLAEEDGTFQRWAAEPTIVQAVRIVLGVFVVSMLARVLGPYLARPSLLPAWLSIAAAWVLRNVARGENTTRPALLAAPLVVFGAVLFADMASSGHAVQRIALAYVALVACGAFLDAVGAHAVALMLARTEEGHERESLAVAWKSRFDPGALAGSPAAPGFIETLSHYQQGFLLLVLVGVLALLPDALLLLLVLPSALAVVLVARAGSPGRDVVRVVLEALESWISYGERAAVSPGLFKSPAGSRERRLALAVLTLFVLSAALTPPAPYGELARYAVQDVGARWALFFHALGALVLPVVVIASAAAVTLAQPLSWLERNLSGAPTRSRWDRFVEKLERSTNPRHRRQFFLGLHATEHYPVFLPQRTLQQHAHILGSTGTGKTSLVVLPLVAQLVRRTDLDGTRLRGPILIIDMKGTDKYAFHAVRELCEREGRAFRFLTNVAGDATHAFNPMLEFIASELTLQQRGEATRSALNVEFGTGYGPGHFSSVSRRYLQLLLRTRPGAESFAELIEARADLLREHGRRWVQEEESQAGELITALDMLAEREELNVNRAWVCRAESPTHSARRQAVLEQRIDMHRAVRDDEVIYLNLFSRSEEAMCRYIASLALETFYAACTLRNRSAAAADRKPAYVFVDEFQKVAGRNFAGFMEQARSSGVALVLANQSRSQLDDELKGAVSNAGHRHFFDFQDPEDLDFIGSLSGETLEFQNRVYSDGRIVEGTTRSAPTSDASAVYWEDNKLGRVPRFTVNDLTALGAHPDVALVKQKQNVDYSQFDGFTLPVRAMHHIPLSEVERLESMAWPAVRTGTLANPSGAQREESEPSAASSTASFFIRPTPTDPHLARLFDSIHLSGEPVPDHYDIGTED